MTCNELNCSSVIPSVIDEGSVEVFLDGLLFLAMDHFGVSWSIGLPVFLVVSVVVLAIVYPRLSL